MAVVGLQHVVVATYNDTTGSAVYSNAKILGRAMTEDITIENNNAELYSDDELSDVDTAFSSGTGTCGVRYVSIENEGFILGHTVDEDEGIVSNAGDVAPYVGHGFISRTADNKWVGIIFPKVKFGEPTIKVETQGKTLTYQTPQFPYTIMKDISGNWKYKNEFDTKADAITYVDTFLNYTTT